MSNWGAQFLQLGWFTPNARNLSASGLFELLFGRQPDQIQQNKVPTPAAPFLSFASSVEGDVEYRVISQPGRIDAYILVPDDLSVSRSGAPILAKTDAHLTLLQERVGAGCEFVGESLRLALVLNLLQQMDSVDAATKLINERIGGMIPFDGASDLNVQVNRRRQLKSVPHTQINRLNRFAVVILQQINMALAGPFQQSDQPLSVVNEFIAANHHIDVNTVPSGQGLTPGQQVQIWNEMFAEALRIRQIGSLMALGDS